MKYILDASVAVRWHIAGEAHANADAILERVLESPEEFAVPELFFFEVYAVLARMLPGFQSLYAENFLPAVEGGLLRMPMTASLADAAALFVARGLTGYDAVYAGLARELGALWLTFDADAHRRIAPEKLSWDVGGTLPSGW